MHEYTRRVATVYFDTNVFFDVFEHRVPSLFPELQALVADGRVQVVVSDLNLVESLAGNHRDSFTGGIERLLTISPRWILLAGITQREVVTAYDGPRKPVVKMAVGALLSWQEFLPGIVGEEDLRDFRELWKPTAEALLAAYPVGSIAQRMSYWKGELKDLQSELREMMVYLRTPQNVFRKLVAATLGRNLGSTRSLADDLWQNVDAVPALRLDVELVCRVLNVVNPKWTTNDFFDHLHAGALGYVDLFVTLDGSGREPGLIQKIEWYDEYVRRPHGAAPYMDRVCRGWADMLAKL